MAEQPKSRDTQGHERGRRPSRGWRKETAPQIERERERYQPTIPSVVEEAFDSPEWVFQIVEEGIPVLLEAGPDGLSIRDRRGRNLNRFFPELLGILERLPSGSVLDADIVNRGNRSEPHDRQLMTDQEIAGRMASHPCVAIAHDLLAWNGIDRTTASTGVRRRELVEDLASLEDCSVVPADVIEANGNETVLSACEQGHPAVRAKMKGSPYPGRETRAWREIPCSTGAKLVAGGVIDPDFDDKHVLRLLAGAFEQGRFTFQRRIRVPENQKALVLDALRPLTRGQHAFHENPGWSPGLHWLAPEMVIQVEGARLVRLRPDLSGRAVHPRLAPVQGSRRRKAAGEPLRLQKRLRFSA